MTDSDVEAAARHAQVNGILPIVPRVCGTLPPILADVDTLAAACSNPLAQTDLPARWPEGTRAACRLGHSETGRNLRSKLSKALQPPSRGELFSALGLPGAHTLCWRSQHLQYEPAATCPDLL